MLWPGEKQNLAMNKIEVTHDSQFIYVRLANDTEEIRLCLSLGQALKVASQLQDAAMRAIEAQAYLAKEEKDNA